MGVLRRPLRVMTGIRLVRREICEDHQGEIPLSVTIVDVPEALGGSSVRIRVNQHFRVQPSTVLVSALEQAMAKPQYVFPKS